MQKQFSEERLEEIEVQSKQFNRFDFEQQILNCWGITTDVNCIYEHFYEQAKIDNDELANALLGLKTLYDIKFEKLWSQFEFSYSYMAKLDIELEKEREKTAALRAEIESMKLKNFSAH